jgi:hypothetical protein
MYLKCHTHHKGGKEHRYCRSWKNAVSPTAAFSTARYSIWARSTTPSRPPGPPHHRRFRSRHPTPQTLALVPAARPLPAHAADYGVQKRHFFVEASDEGGI